MIQWIAARNPLIAGYVYTARPVPISTIGLEEIKRLIHLRDKTIPEDVARDTLETFADVCGYQLSIGNTVKITNFVSFVTTITGRLENPTDDINKESFNVKAKIERSFVEKVRAIVSFVNIGTTEKEPSIFSFMDAASFVRNWIRDGYAAVVDGENLNFDRSDEQQGIFLTSPAGNTYKVDNISASTAKKLIYVNSLDSELGPAGKASVGYDLVIKARYTVNGELKTGVYKSKIRSTVYIDQSNAYLFVVGEDTEGPAEVTGYEGADTLAVVVAYLSSRNKLLLAASDIGGQLGQGTEVNANGTFNLTGASQQVSVKVTDIDKLISSTVAAGRYFQEVVSLTAQLFEMLLAYNRPAYTTGIAFAEQNTNRQSAALSGNRIATVSRRNTDIAQTLVYSIDSLGVVTQGTVSEDTFPTNAFSSATHGVCPIGNNKFIRFANYWNGSTYDKGYPVWDCGESGLIATLVEENNNGVTTATPGGWSEAVMHSDGKIYSISASNELQVCNIDNVTNLTSSMQSVSDFFGSGRTVAYYGSGDAGEMRGTPIPTGGVVYFARLSDSSMWFITVEGTSQQFFQCSDTDGYPLAIAIDESGVLCAAYITTTGECKLVTGIIDSSSIEFGESILLYGGGTSTVDISDMYGSDNSFFFVKRNDGESLNNIFKISADGSSISCDDKYSAFYKKQDSSSHIELTDSGFVGEPVLMYNIGAVDRYLQLCKKEDLFILPVTSGKVIDVELAEDEWKWFRIKSLSTDNYCGATLTNLTEDLDLYLLKWAPPLFRYDDASRNNGTTDEYVEASNTGETDWYIGVLGYRAGSGTLQISTW